MIRSNPWRLGNSSSRAPTLRPGPTHWQAWSHRHWQSESGTATWQWQCTQAATGSVRVPGPLPLATRSWPCDVQVRRCIQTSSRSPVPRRLRHGRTRRQARSTCATKRICPEKCSHTGNTRGHRNCQGNACTDGGVHLVVRLPASPSVLLALGSPGHCCHGWNSPWISHPCPLLPGRAWTEGR